MFSVLSVVNILRLYDIDVLVFVFSVLALPAARHMTAAEQRRRNQAGSVVFYYCIISCLLYSCSDLSHMAASCFAVVCCVSWVYAIIAHFDSERNDCFAICQFERPAPIMRDIIVAIDALPKYSHSPRAIPAVRPCLDYAVAI